MVEATVLEEEQTEGSKRGERRQGRVLCRAEVGEAMLDFAGLQAWEGKLKSCIFILRTMGTFLPCVHARVT